MDERLTPFEDKMKKSYHNLIEELGTVRAGRANPHVLGRRTPIYATSASSRINIQTGSVAAPIADSLWADDHIWRDCSPDG